ncbi:MAG TPA: CpsB/CapC family capsule biosynthesis tyrosine phosphatase [Bacteroidales bacterium]|nr:CpsB/CapC family capsule biosynthesis tyrosine phosphatase [Bacteroidales bacterium]
MNLLEQLFKWKKLKTPVDLSPVETDMHSHLIPGIDDGAPDMATVITLLDLLSQMGFKKVITTPHIMKDLYRNSSEIILEGEAKVKEAIKEAGIPIDFKAGAEYLVDDGFTRLVEQKDLLTISDNYLLIELPYFSPPAQLSEILFELQLAGYKVILAHPERYAYWHGHFGRYEDLHARGLYFQLNIISLSGYYSSHIRKLSQKLIDARMIDFLGTDLHSLQYFQIMEKALLDPFLAKLVNSGRLKNPYL